MNIIFKTTLWTVTITNLITHLFHSFAVLGDSTLGNKLSDKKRERELNPFPHYFTKGRAGEAERREKKGRKERERSRANIHYLS